MTITWTTVAGWLLHTAVGGGLLLLLTRMAMGRARQPALRQRLGECGLLGALAVAALSPAPAWLELPWAVLPESAPLPPKGAEPAPTDDVFAGLRFEAAEAAFPTEPVPPPAAPIDRSPEPVPPAEEAAAPLLTYEALDGLCRAFVLAYALLAGLFVARWLLGHVALARLRRGACPPPADVAELFVEVAGRTRARLLVSPRVRVPLSYGLFRPTVLLPVAMCRSAPPERLRWVFAHELTHLARGDAWSALLLAAGHVAFFYLPWFWAVRRQVRLCQEYVADAVAAGGEPAADYAEFLLSLTASPPVPRLATGVSGDSSDLYRRVTMLLQDPLRVEPRCPRRRLLAAAAGLLALAALVSSVGLRAEAGPAEESEPAPAPTPGVRVIVLPAPGSDAKDVFIYRAAPPKDVLFLKKKDAGPEGVRVHFEPAPQKEVFYLRQGIAKVLKDGVEFEVKPLPDQKAYPVPVRVLAQPGQRVPVAVDMSQSMVSPAGLPKDVADALRDALKRLDGEVDRKTLDQVREDLKKLLSDRRAAMLRSTPLAVTEADVTRYLYTPAKAVAVPARGRLGVSVEKPSPVLAEQVDLPKGQGLVVTEVEKNSPAAKAGVKVNDILVEVDGKPVPDAPEALIKLVGDVKGERNLDLVVVRKGKRETVRGVQFIAPAQADVRLYDAAKQLKATLFGQAPESGVRMTTFRTGDRFNARYEEGSLIITVTGTLTEGKAQVSEVHIRDGSESSRFDNVGAVPARYRDKVGHVIDTATRGEIRTRGR